MSTGSQLGAILEQAGLVEADQRQGYEVRAKSEGRPFGELLLADGICLEEEICQALASQLGLPPVSLTQLGIQGYVAKMLPRDMAERLLAIPVSVKSENDDDVLYVAFFDPTDPAVIQEVTGHTKKKVKPVVATRSEILAAIKRYLVPLKRRGGAAAKEAEKTKAAPAKPAEAKPRKEAAPVPALEKTTTQEIDEADLVFEEESGRAPVAKGDASPETPMEIATKSPELDLEDFSLDLNRIAERKAEPEPFPEAGGEESASLKSLWDDGNSGGDSEAALAAASPEDTNAFLHFDAKSLAEQDESIIRMQQEAEKAKQEVVFGSEMDVAFDEEKADAAPSPKPAEDNEPFATFDSEEFDLDADEPPASAVAPGASEKAVDLASAAEPLESEIDSEEEEFDFDIPEAPEFPSDSGRIRLAKADGEAKSASKAKAAATAEKDWSLDLDALFDAKDPSGKGEETSFEMAAEELDALLDEMENSETRTQAAQRADSAAPPAELLDELARLAESGELTGSEEEVRFIFDFLNGKTATDDPKVHKLQSVLASMADLMIEKGFIDEPDFIKTFFTRRLRHRQ
ncbi:MAG: hypothetical protein C4523_08700 [Myxococcales bacterium]|nr:MAG: hypothetical protein C4523_08700 [Myxococcales bacterium]